MEDCLVAEAGKALCQDIYQSCSGEVGAVDAVDEAATEFLCPVSITRLAKVVRDNTSQRTSPASRRHCTRSLNIGISPSVADRNTCLSSSSVHLSSSTQKSGVVIGISEAGVSNRHARSFSHLPGLTFIKSSL